MTPVRLGIVGCGGISERHGNAATGCADAAMVACCDVNAGRAEAWRERYGCERAYDDYLEMVREHELDGVLLATWPVQHREQILACLEAGVRHILCEKSLAMNGEEALEIWTAAREVGARVVEAFMYRHHPAIQRIDALLDAGELGALDSIFAAFSIFDAAASAPDDPGRDWRQRQDCGGGVPWDLACYCVDACNHLARGRPLRALAVASTSERYGTTDRLFGLIEYEGGLVGTLESSKAADFNHELRLSGATGTVVLPVAWRIEGAAEVVISRSTGWGEFDTARLPIAAVDPYRLQLESFASVVREDGAQLPTFVDSVVGALTMDALLTSAAERASVEIELPGALERAGTSP